MHHEKIKQFIRSHRSAAFHPVRSSRVIPLFPFQAAPFPQLLSPYELIGEFLQISTARIGALPETAAVDSQLRVLGVKGLRVVDAFLFLNQISGHTAAVVVAVAEKAANIIKTNSNGIFSGDTMYSETLRAVLGPGKWRWPRMYDHLNAITIAVQNSLLRP